MQVIVCEYERDKEWVEAFVPAIAPDRVSDVMATTCSVPSRSRALAHQPCRDRFGHSEKGKASRAQTSASKAK
jgi:hypothetical protein